MIVQTKKEIKNLLKSGRAIRAALNAMSAAAKPGISTFELDQIALITLEQHQSKSAPSRIYKFPGNTCISLNDEALHGIPNKNRILQAGDLLKLDIVAERYGVYTDACVTVLVEPESCTDIDRKLIECAQTAFNKALGVIKPGILTNEIGIVIEVTAKEYGFSVLTGFGGHGIGKTIHEAPFVPNYNMPDCKEILEEGMVIAVEPIICEKLGAHYTAVDGWTILTQDSGRVAHYENTVIVTKDNPIVVTL